MSDRPFRIATVVLALAGIAVAGYVLSVRRSGGTLMCATGGYSTVQASPYAEVLGLPVAALGLAGFATILILAVLRGEAVRLACVSLALAAFAFSGYLLAVQLIAIGVLCDWCLVSDGITTGASRPRR